MRKCGSFVGGLGGQMTWTLEGKYEAKVNYDLAEIEFDLLMMRVPSAVFTPCLHSALIQGNTADSEFLGR